jgi:hypothetical protein
MSVRQELFTYWLAIRNVRVAIENGDGNRMIKHQKQIRQKLGWRFRSMSDEDRVNEISKLADRMERQFLPLEDDNDWPEFS